MSFPNKDARFEKGKSETPHGCSSAVRARRIGRAIAKPIAFQFPLSTFAACHPIAHDDKRGWPSVG